MPAEKNSEKSEKKTEVAKDSGQNIATVGFAIAVASIITNFFTLGIMAVVGLALSIVGRVQTKRAGNPSGLALAGIIISSVVMFLTFVAFVFFIMLVVLSNGTDCSTSTLQNRNHAMCRSSNGSTMSPQYYNTQGYDNSGL